MTVCRIRSLRPRTVERLRPTSRHPKRWGFMMADAVAGFLVVGVVAGVLMTALHRQRAATAQLAAGRAVGRLAEHVLLDLQQGQPQPPVPPGVRVAVRTVSVDQPPAGYAWAAVDVTDAKRQATLVGLVPTASPEGRR